MARRSAPTYLTFSRDAWHLRFRYVDSLGQVHWPRERSPWPADYRLSVQWAPIRRAEIIQEIEAELRRLDPEAPVTLGQVLDAYEADCRQRGTRLDKEGSRLAVIRETLGAVAVEDLTPARLQVWREDLRATRGRRQ